MTFTDEYLAAALASFEERGTPDCPLFGETLLDLATQADTGEGEA